MRTDIHSPSRIKPEDYEYVCTRYAGADDVCMLVANQMAAEKFQAHQAHTGGFFSRHEHGGSCHICGAHACSLATFHHAPTNTYIATGLDCAEKLFNHADFAAQFRDYRRTLEGALKNRRAARELKAGKAKAELLLEDAGISKAWAYYVGNAYNEPTNDNWLLEKRQQALFKLCDVVDNVVKYGRMSDRQQSFLESLCDQIKRCEEEAELAEIEVKPEAPTGRAVIQGKILSRKTRETDFGFVEKMVLESPEGWRCWCTVPAALDDAEVGDEVELAVTLEQSPKDPSFAFGKRPARASILSQKCEA